LILFIPELFLDKIHKTDISQIPEKSSWDPVREQLAVALNVGMVSK
jgi:hypothetical protein